ncbi:hypothetical protein [Paraburkholderia eburnea]|nr:hypothetical protein [Paraburkholderia eburnea]
MSIENHPVDAGVAPHNNQRFAGNQTRAKSADSGRQLCMETDGR